MISETFSERNFAFSDIYLKQTLSHKNVGIWMLILSPPSFDYVNSDFFIQILHERISNIIA